MKIDVEVGDIATWEDGVIAVNPFEGVIRPGGATEGRMWELPLWVDCDEIIKSDVADVKNVGGKTAGAIAAAVFLKNFGGGLPRAHLDIAGVAWVEPAPESPKREYLPKGASGWGVRLLVRMLRDWSVAG